MPARLALVIAANAVLRIAGGASSVLVGVDVDGGRNAEADAPERLVPRGACNVFIGERSFPRRQRS